MGKTAVLCITVLISASYLMNYVPFPIVHVMPVTRSRTFAVDHAAVIELHAADVSDDDGELDCEDIEFLKTDVNRVGEEVVIDPPGVSSEPSHDPPAPVPKRKKDSPVQWRRTEVQNGTFVPETDDSVNYGTVNIDLSDGDFSPLSIFKKVNKFDVLVDLLETESTRFAHQKGVTFETCSDELSAFIGILTVMGYNQLPTFRDYWSTAPDLGVSVVSSCMPRARFEELRDHLHYVDNETGQGGDRAWKVRPLINHMNDAWTRAMTATKVQSVDEHMVKFKGHSKMRQFIASKPIKHGFKMWCRCDAATGYLFCCDLYTGKKENVEKGLGEGIVLQLCEGLPPKVEVFEDNFFTTMSLMDEMSGRGLLTTGIIVKNRKGLPPFAPDSKMKKGDLDTYEATGEYGPLYASKWIDNRPLHMLSNYIPSKLTSTTMRRVAGKKEKEVFMIPLAVKHYNKGMGGVDLMGQKKKAYGLDRRSKRKPYLRIGSELIDIGLNNAFEVYELLRKRRPGLGIKPVTMLDFRRSVALSFINSFTSRKRGLQSVRQGGRLALTPTTQEHTIGKKPQRKRCVECAKDNTENRTDNVCQECDVHLCYTTKRNCFAAYHAK